MAIIALTPSAPASQYPGGGSGETFFSVPLPLPPATINPVVPGFSARSGQIIDQNTVLPNGNTIPQEFGPVFERLFGLAPGTFAFDQYRPDGTIGLTSSSAGIALTQAPRIEAFATNVGRRAQLQQLLGSVTLDPDNGAIWIISPNDFSLTLVPAPVDMLNFLRIMDERRNVLAAALQPTGGQLLLTTIDPDLQLSMRPGFLSQPGSPPPSTLLLTNADGSMTIVYPDGRQQPFYPVALDRRAVDTFLMRNLPGISIQGTLEGDIVVTGGERSVTLRPQYEVRRCPSCNRGEMAMTVDGGGGLVVDYPAVEGATGAAAHARRQRFTIGP